MEVKIGGIIKESLVDVLFHPSYVIFFSYCNFRCPWCQNGPLVLGEGKEIKIEEIIKDVKENFLIDYVQANGGEPTLQKEALIELFEKVKEIGKKTSLVTNSSNPNVLKELVDEELIDHLATDIKAPPEKYPIVTGVNIDFKRIEKSLSIIKDLDFIEIRTTIVPNLITKEDIFKIMEIVQSYLDNFYYVLQQFYPSKTILNPKFRNLKPANAKELIEIGKELKKKGIDVFIRAKETGVYKI